MKKIYTVFILLYMIVIIGFFFKYELSYIMTNLSPNVIDHRDFTNSEMESFKKAISIRKVIVNTLFIFSIAISIFSRYVISHQIFKSGIFPRTIFAISVAIVLIIALARSINFIGVSPFMSG